MLTWSRQPRPRAYLPTLLCVCRVFGLLAPRAREEHGQIHFECTAWPSLGMPRLCKDAYDT